MTAKYPFTNNLQLECQDENGSWIAMVLGNVTQVSWAVACLSGPDRRVSYSLYRAWFCPLRLAVVLEDLQ